MMNTFVSFLTRFLRLRPTIYRLPHTRGFKQDVDVLNKTSGYNGFTSVSLLGLEESRVNANIT